jgi:uracil-DNA glycosylase family 4
MSLVDCKRCRRLSQYLKKSRQQYPDYYSLPVSAFGDPDAKLLIVGLAPGLHGANATARPFTGDASGEFLFRTLYKYGFSSHSISTKNDKLELYNCRLTNAVKCLPPQNKPTTLETKTCAKYHLHDEIMALQKGSVILALGSIAHNTVLRTFSKTLSNYAFGHNQCFDLENGYYLLNSYHCSRYNTQTKRLTELMFDRVFENAKRLLSQPQTSQEIE